MGYCPALVAADGNTSPERPALDGISELACAYALFQTAFWRSDSPLQGVQRALVPFLATALKRANQDVITVAEVQREFSALFGLSLPPNVIDGLLRRARKEGLVERHTEDGTTYLTLNRERLATFPDTADQSRALREEYNKFVARFREYCREQFGRTLNRREAETGLHVWLLRRISEISDLPIYVANGGVPAPDSSDDAGTVEYMLARFILDHLPEEPALQDYLDRIVKGSALATSVYFRGADPQRLAKSMKSLRVYFDTPLLLSLFGFHKREHEEAAQDLLKLVKDSGATACVFEHTQTELKNVLRASVEDMRGAKHGLQLESTMPVVERVVDLRLAGRMTDLGRYLSLAERSRAELQDKFGFEVVERASLPRPDEDIPRLESEIAERYGSVASRTITFDVESLLGVYRSRYGQSFGDLHESRAILVTTNPMLVEASRAYFGTTNNDVPVAIMDHALATLLWLRGPMELPSVPWKQVIADCYAALYPGEELWRKYLHLLAELRDREQSITEEDYFLLRFSVGARLALMDDTQGEAGVLTIGSIGDILDRAREHLMELGNQRLQSAEDAAARATAYSERAEEDVRQLRQELERLERDAASRADHDGLVRLETARALLAAQCAKRARRTKRILAACAAAAVAAGAGAAVYSIESGRDLPATLAIALVVLVAAAGLLGYLDLVHGLNLPAIEQRQAERCTESRFEELCGQLASSESPASISRTGPR